MGSGASSLRRKDSARVGEVEPGPVAVISEDRQSSKQEIIPPTEDLDFTEHSHNNALAADRSELEINYYPDEQDENTDRHLTNCFSQETPHQNSAQPPLSARSGYSDGGAAAAEMFAYTALSLGMENDDLLFNLMYFDSGDNSTFGTMMNNVQSETLALHSENNTPYKLKPASTSAISGLPRFTFGVDFAVTREEKEHVECECAVCKDDIEDETPILQIPSCQHFFHEDCLLRWINLQGWCPVCRAPIEAATVLATAGLCQESIPEEGPTTETDQGVNESSPASPGTDTGIGSGTASCKSRSPALRLFDNEEEVIPVRCADSSVDSFPSQKYGSDVSKAPGQKQCV